MKLKRKSEQLAGQVWNQLVLLGHNLGSFLRKFGVPKTINDWSLRSLQLKLITLGSWVVRRARRIVFQLAAAHLPRGALANILPRVRRLRSLASRLFSDPALWLTVFGGLLGALQVTLSTSPTLAGYRHILLSMQAGIGAALLCTLFTASLWKSFPRWFLQVGIPFSALMVALEPRSQSLGWFGIVAPFLVAFGLTYRHHKDLGIFTWWIFFGVVFVLAFAGKDWIITASAWIVVSFIVALIRIAIAPSGVRIKWLGATVVMVLYALGPVVVAASFPMPQ